MKEMSGSSVILPIGSLDIYFSLLTNPKIITEKIQLQPNN